MLKRSLAIFELPIKSFRFLVIDLIMFLIKFSIMVVFWPLKLVRSIFSSSHTRGWRIPYIWLLLSSVIVWISKKTGLLWEYMNLIKSSGFIINPAKTPNELTNKIETIIETLTSGIVEPDRQGLFLLISLSVIEIIGIITIIFYGMMNSTVVFWITVFIFIGFTISYLMFLSSITTPFEYARISFIECIMNGIIVPVREIIYYGMHFTCCMVYVFLPGINLILYSVLKRMRKTQYLIPLWSFEYSF